MLRTLIQQHVTRRSYTTTATERAYFISRTANKGLPVYTDFKNGGTQQLTIIRRVEGDAEALKNEIVELFPEAPKNFARVNPVNNQVILKGVHMNEIKQWLVEKGF
ncbi:mitochondrial ribosomal protein subunit Img2 [Zychaea mexicana]|uniref:mitochondrial ribosomal protein subunit Img2 n=1 Tax=Zychaea mexicana TaxID=64656 RepID=UPI0022FDF1E8|nr:mitochondrial ribosomal protein subunit Img2 [Zychaea mexicana]KAI9499230.1 mitochondrial ribosomal protein subunit Img2 [Zychaea mexicana]